MKVRIHTPDRSYPETEARSVSAPAEKGRMTVLPGHQPTICRLGSGKLLVQEKDGSSREWLVGKGTMKIAGDVVTVLSHDVRSEPLRK